MSPTKKIELARFIVTQVVGNPNFPSPTPSLATLATAANNAEAALLAAKRGSANDKATLRTKIAELNLVLSEFGDYVKNHANTNPNTAEAVILSAGLQVRKKATHTTPDFSAMLTGKPREVKLQHKAVTPGSYEFQICTDLTNEANWVTFAVGTLSRVVKGGLAPNTRYYFRARVIGRDGYSAWSEVRSVFIME